MEGLRDFQGELIHTATWPKGFDYGNKTVAVIGNGSSGIQLLPAIQPGESPNNAEPQIQAHLMQGHRRQKTVPRCPYANMDYTALATGAAPEWSWSDIEGDSPR